MNDVAEAAMPAFRRAIPQVMPGLVPGIHVFRRKARYDVDGQDEPGHDD
jgi:hypothetical protein